MENKTKNVRKTFIEEEVKRQIDAKLKTITVEHIHIDEREDSFLFQVASWVLRIGALYGFVQYSIFLYGFIYNLFNSSPF